MAKQVRLNLANAIAKANLRRAEAGEKAITMNSLSVAAGVAATTITRLARTDEKGASALSLDLAGKIVTVLDCGIEDLLEVIEGAGATINQPFWKSLSPKGGLENNRIRTLFLGKRSGVGTARGKLHLC